LTSPKLMEPFQIVRMGPFNSSREEAISTHWRASLPK
jgi:hypothetical protein